MNPLLRQILFSQGLSRRGLVDVYTFTDLAGSQILAGRKGNHGQNGSTTGVDANDVTFDGVKATFSGGNYIKLPYLFDAKGDFTVYVAANVPAANPAGAETYFSIGKSSDGSPRLSFYRNYSGAVVTLYARNDDATIDKTVNFPITTGIRLLKLTKVNGYLSIADVGSGATSTPFLFTGTLAFNQMAFGCLLRSTVTEFLNQPIYYAIPYNVAKNNAEDVQNYKFVKSELAKRGVSLG